MFSICIPVYNYNINELVNDLILQLDQCKFNYEIVVIDDFSKSLFKKANTNLKSNEKIVYIELEKNIGRSAIRNLFIKYTRFENLIFLDCDSKLLTTQFIGIYRNAMLQNHKVVCGGRDYLRKPKERKYKLRWKYGHYRECMTEGERNKNPYRSFMTNNFLIHKSILKKIKFEERIKGYGHEDTLFGYQLMKSSIPVKHIDNQAIIRFLKSPYNRRKRLTWHKLAQDISWSKQRLSALN
jgi:glycosyltransferase involved in cell wall biosynthesis